ncbi:MAG TPA: UDP-N-acetylmuramate dehydrogenase [Smithella sp.]|nr:UDP-N-acetylmuramate dehydrogenase [Smithella sp.]
MTMHGVNRAKEALIGVEGIKVLYDEPMSRHTSLGVGGKADALVFVENQRQLADLVGLLKEKEIDYFPAGNLTNVIVRDGGYRGAILLMTRMKNIRHRYEEGGACEVAAQAGASLAKLVGYTVTEALTGMEFCAGIPGSVGGAVWMNAGAYGREIKDVITHMTVLDADGNICRIRKEAVSFGYRRSDFAAGTIILDAEFRLEKGESGKMREKINEILQWRQEKHPLDFPSAGSVFKNLPGLAAGKIIEEMGLKGIVHGGAQVSVKHANFIINRGEATASDVLALMAMIQSRAKEEKQVILEPEVVVIGEDPC